MTNRNIKRFRRTGYVDDMGDMVNLWPGLEKNLVNVMKLQGFVPVLDIVPYRGVQYIESDEQFKYELVIQGVYVGKRRAELTEGLLSGRRVGKPIPPNKSVQSSEASE